MGIPAPDSIGWFGDLRRAVVWVDLRRSNWDGAHPRDWPPSPTDSHGDAYYFVRWRGSLEGPGRYGTMGLYAYRLRVDSVLEVIPKRAMAAMCDDPSILR